jgi:hypothetical protein
LFFVEFFFWFDFRTCVPAVGHGTLGFGQGAAHTQVSFLLHFLRSGFASRPPGSSRILIHGHLLLLVRFQVPLEVFPACLFGLCCRAPGTFSCSAFPPFSAALAFVSALPHPARFFLSSSDWLRFSAAEARWRPIACAFCEQLRSTSHDF